MDHNKAIYHKFTTIRKQFQNAYTTISIKNITKAVVRHPRHVTVGLLLLLFIWFLVAATKHRVLVFRRDNLSDRKKKALHDESVSKTSNRPLGVWMPINFERPAATQYPNWNIHQTEPRPYRPFKYGSYHITMGLRTMEWNEWIELDNQYLKFHAIKAKRIEERGNKCCKTAPEAYDGAIELLEELFSYLPQRYPTLFQATPTGLTNLHTHETFTLIPPLREDPMTTAGRLVQDDLAIMFERPDGQYYLLAGSILLPGFWRLSEKFGMPLSEIHTSGDVPEFRTKLEKGMNNFFRRVQPHTPVARHNYFIQVDDDLAWSASIGLEDGDGGGSWGNAAPATDITTHHFRTERQTLRRLPRSGGVVFTIRTYFEPITKVAAEPGVPGRLASAIRSWGPDTARYKGREKYGDALLAYLDRRHKEQLAAGEAREGEVEEDAARAKSLNI